MEKVRAENEKRVGSYGGVTPQILGAA